MELLLGIHTDQRDEPGTVLENRGCGEDHDEGTWG